METIVQSSQQHAITEDWSDRSESSTMSQDFQIRGFEGYEVVKRLKLADGERSIGRNEDNHLKHKNVRLSVETIGSVKEQRDSGIRLDEVNGNWRELAVSIGKSKECGYDVGQIGDALNYQMDRRNETEVMENSHICRNKELTVKEVYHARQKFINANFDFSPKKLNNVVEQEIKEYGLSKGYNPSLDRMKEFNLPLDRMRDGHMTVLPRERLGNIGFLDNSRIIDATDHRNLHVQTRSPHIDTMNYERMRRSQHHLLNPLDFTAQNLVATQLPRQSIASQMQHNQQQQQQPQQQPQIKSFTIDAILAHRNNYKERHRNQHQHLRKAARLKCQEVTLKTGSSISGHNTNGPSNGSGKAKRVRTIFTAEQLERLEREFARQQYMVGPERLYLAHELGLTEAQVKVWFQNRRIKWRKVNHEQQCLVVNEHRQRCILPGLDIHEINEDEPNENNSEWCRNSSVSGPMTTADNGSSTCSQIRELRDLRSSPIIKV